MYMIKDCLINIINNHVIISKHGSATCFNISFGHSMLPILGMIDMMITLNFIQRSLYLKKQSKNNGKHTVYLGSYPTRHILEVS